MKKHLSAALCICLSLCLLASCTGQAAIKTKKQLVASFYPIYIFTMNLTNGLTDVTLSDMAEQNTGCLHDYQLLAGDVRQLEAADAFIINGAGMEGFLNEVAEAVGTINIVDSSVGIALCGAADGKKNDEANSHIWMSVANAIEQVDNISDGLKKLLPNDEKKIEANRASYVSRLTALKAELLSKAKPLKNKPIVTFHEAYDYMAKELSLTIVASVESDEGGEPSAKELASLSVKMKRLGVKALFTDPNYKGSAAGILAAETNAKVYEINPVTAGDKTLTAYEDIMRNNIRIIVKAVG